MRLPSEGTMKSPRRMHCTLGNGMPMPKAASDWVKPNVDTRGVYATPGQGSFVDRAVSRLNCRHQGRM